jgi:hypothetical protein
VIASTTRVDERPGRFTGRGDEVVDGRGDREPVGRARRGQDAVPQQRRIVVEAVERVPGDQPPRLDRSRRPGRQQGRLARPGVPTDEGDRRVAQRLSPTAAATFPELAVSAAADGTVLFGPVRDDAELHGILARLQLFGLTILDVHRLPD